MGHAPPKPARIRTDYQKAVLVEIRKFCPPVPAKGVVTDKQEIQKYLLRPYESAMMPNGEVAVVWFAEFVGTKKAAKWLNYAHIEETRKENVAFGVFLDWCDERRLVYKRARPDELPHYKYRRGVSHTYHFQLRIPREAK